jgi:ATP-dependent RNA helicase DDX18/HAS1
MFLLESELGFLRYLKEAKVPLNEFTFPTDRIANVQSQVGARRLGDMNELIMSVYSWRSFCKRTTFCTSRQEMVSGRICKHMHRIR